MWLLLALCYRELRTSEKHDEFLSRSRQNRSGNPTSCRGAAGKIADPDTAKGLRTLLIPPRQEQRTWDWHKPYVQYPVWVVAESSRYDYGIVFSDYGFAPECLGVCFFRLTATSTPTIAGVPAWNRLTESPDFVRSLTRTSRRPRANFPVLPLFIGT